MPARTLADQLRAEEPRAEVLQRYAGVGARWVLPDVEEVRKLGLRPLTGRFISQSAVVRHDSEKLAEAIIRAINRGVRPALWMFDHRDWW